jgi:hypothetical protein
VTSVDLLNPANRINDSSARVKAAIGTARAAAISAYGTDGVLDGWPLSGSQKEEDFSAAETGSFAEFLTGRGANEGPGFGKGVDGMEVVPELDTFKVLEDAGKAEAEAAEEVYGEASDSRVWEEHWGVTRLPEYLERETEDGRNFWDFVYDFKESDLWDMLHEGYQDGNPQRTVPIQFEPRAGRVATSSVSHTRTLHVLLKSD